MLVEDWDGGVSRATKSGRWSRLEAHSIQQQQRRRNSGWYEEPPRHALLATTHNADRAPRMVGKTRHM